MFFSFLVAIILLLLTYYINIIHGGIDNLSLQKYGYYTGYLISLSDTAKEDIEKIGLISDENDNEGYIVAKKIISEEKIKQKLVNYDTYEDMLYDLYKGKIEGAFVQSNYTHYFSSITGYENINSETKVIYKKTLKL